jgi:hypothetical protein
MNEDIIKKVQGFNEQNLKQQGLNNEDALVLRYFVEFIYGRQHINYKKIEKDLNIVGIDNAPKIGLKFKKLVDKKILKSKKFEYLTFGRKFFDLIDKKEKEKIKLN